MTKCIYGCSRHWNPLSVLPQVLEKERIVDIADVERVAREIHILKLIRHPHIIQLYEIIETPRQLSACSDEGEWT